MIDVDIRVCERNRVSKCTINCMCETHENKNLPFTVREFYEYLLI